MTRRRKTVQQIKADVFVAIAHPVRREILQLLAEQEQTVTNLTEPFDMTQSAISQHLSILLESGLVSKEKRGRKHYYQIRPENLNQVREWVNYFEHLWLQKLDALETLLDEKAAEQDNIDNTEDKPDEDSSRI